MSLNCVYKSYISCNETMFKAKAGVFKLKQRCQVNLTSVGSSYTERMCNC